MAKDLASARDRRRAATPTVAERQAELLSFYERFERFVEVLCDAAQYGPNARLEKAYLADRQWIVDHFESLRPFVAAYLSPDEPDAFERLFKAEDLSRFLAEDDGEVIFRITSTREALSLYAEHLRQLATRKGS
ncbi:hypothetical protein EON82_05645 [bacterium]|nr:MAG: hypothetical protein EON82_05645 [bacterium]